MGQQIDKNRFTDYDFKRFQWWLEQETDLLAQRFEHANFADLPLSAGLELEAWLVDKNYQALAVNRAFINEAADPLIVPELSRFNFELNSQPVELSGHALSIIHNELQNRWDHCIEAATRLDAMPLMIGILPTLKESRLCLNNMSEQQRYHALNQQIFRQRHGWPIHLKIEGEHEYLDTRHDDVMLESATTSFQVHLRIPLAMSVNFYNASLLASAYVVAVSANSPYLFGHNLWAETRIPVFEQAVRSPVRTGCEDLSGRVNFGRGYARQSLLECFQENLICFEPLLPIELDKYPSALSHLRLHNGTIWRWNRPLLGFEDDGQAHLRIEHRIIPAGPTLIDSIANMALYYGLALHFCEFISERKIHLPDFRQLRADFYKAARFGMQAAIQTPVSDSGTTGEKSIIQHQLNTSLLECAAEALISWGLDSMDVERYLGVIQARLINGQTGSAWQRAFVSRWGKDWQQLTREYMQRQNAGEAVHNWSL